MLSSAHHFNTISLSGEKERISLKRNAAYEVCALNSTQLFPSILQPQTLTVAEGTSQTEVVDVSSKRNPVYEEVQ